MPDNKEKFRDLEPTVVPAQPGFRLATLGYGEDDKIDNNTKTEDIWVFYRVIIAWIVRPQIRDATGVSEVHSAGVDIVTTNGLNSQEDTYIVDPNGIWSDIYGTIFENKTEARKDFIKNHIDHRVLEGSRDQ